MGEDTSEHRRANRLAGETSPYLLQHAHNPVDWHPWGPDAFAAARDANKPIFLSVGYSTCYWCHVMERESFENPRVASEMNRRFINIKVDREERPDVDQLYMTAVQILTGRGGWPMSVFLTPDLQPFYGGTYYPPEDSHGRPGLVTILRAIEDAYHQRRADVDQSARQIVEILRQASEPAPPTHPVAMDQAWLAERIERSIGDYDAGHGGFGAAPKFPRQTLLELLLRYCSTLAGNPDLHEARDARRRQGLLRMVRHTLDAMAAGGIRDQLGGGFHRYATDARWLVPHFEIMLYDNAMLAWVYLEAYRQTEVLEYAHIARGIMDFVLRDLTSPHGAFHTALDAETDAREGATYLWTPAQVQAVLGAADADVFNRVYGMDRGFNFADPHHGEGAADRNVLYLSKPIAAVAEELGADRDAFDQRLAGMRQKLLAARARRPQPTLDRKILTSWNALMIRALAYGGQLLNEPRYLDAAAGAANYLLVHHRTPDGALIRSSRPDLAAADPQPPMSGDRSIPAFLDDYAFFMQALIALRDATGQDAWQEHAATLAMVMLDRFGDQERGGFYFTQSGQDDILVRQKIGTDSPLPSGNAVAALALIDLGHADQARRTLECFAGTLDANPESCSALLQVALRLERTEGPVRVSAGPAPAPDRPASLEQAAKNAVRLSGAWSDDRTLALRVEILDGFHINAHPPAPGLRAAELAVRGDAASLVEAIDYPPGQSRRFAFTDAPISVYQGAVTFTVRFKQPLAGRVAVGLTLSYQPCDDSACLPPVNQSITIAVA